MTTDDGNADAVAASKKKDKSGKPRSFLRELPILIAVALLLSFLLQTFVARVYLIPSQSMEPTLHGCPGCTGDRIIVQKISYRFRDPKPGEVVVFLGPPSWNDGYQSIRSDNVVVRGLQNIGSVLGVVPPDENNLVKRVIATGGQTVQCRNSEGGVTVNGKLLDEPYLDNSLLNPVKQVNPCLGREFGPITVPDGNLWVMGDNRLDSKDSRYHVSDELQGTVPVDNVRGKAVFIILPPGRMGTISSPDIDQN
ncbi:signal peptidase I [Antrihabitans sp. YC2-6]|uniref:signal peptidase I n=1 Tax=Antrihabitans sp. YC2-6 TaxID=2799498 RepID=UPI0018F67A81|nr:signal peptidase I [Antrihabitans sp. YC2-6]MBJ8343294.1 signal peptidase I [Antrihabitans sp. YC2-6]